uniref:Phospholipid scramblase n=1 Tax=Alexandrium monilatum TaxID=311494 RepID=A0A7S4SH34_9DINO|mmetsp:Transcript_11378/g.34295  ORF Transcript_11378/g.34295 Transcript_11378/m.34295 type:complete len:257 (-) Transcript_11378:63-833(-)
MAQIIGTPHQQDMGGLDMFESVERLFVKQEFAAMELCGIEAKNRYRICTDKPENEGGTQTMYVGESGEACERICCSACRSYTLTLYKGRDTSGTPALTFEKTFHCPMMPWPILLYPGTWPFVCPIMCCAMAKPPEMAVREGSTLLGTIMDPPGPLFCCKMDSIIMNASGNQILHVGPKSMCSCGMCCPCCGEEKVPVTRDGTEVATITRTALSCEEVCGKMNRFEIDFRGLRDLTEKKLIIAAAFLLDTQYWDQKG